VSRCVLGGLLAALTLGCEQPEVEDVPVAKAAPLAVSTDSAPMLTAEELRRQLGTDERATFRRVGTDIVEVGLAGAGVKTIEPLKGLPLRKLDLGFCTSINDITVLTGMPLNTLILEGTSVGDLSPIKGMPLQVLHLQDTPVKDLSMIQGMPLERLNLKGVQVSDVGPFANLPLLTLWLPGTSVSDISPLAEMSLESLDLQDTAVSDISALSHMTTLRRLNLAGTPITDIRPVTGLRLERIVLTPQTITQGMEELREITSLGQIWISQETRFSANDFWERYDIGAWSSDSEETNAAPAADGTAKEETETDEAAPGSEEASTETSDPVVDPAVKADSEAESE